MRALLALCAAFAACAQAAPVLKLVTLTASSSGMCYWQNSSLYYSRSVVVGDINGDGNNDIALTNNYEYGPQSSDYSQGAVCILFMNSNLSIKSSQKLTLSDVVSAAGVSLQSRMYQYFGKSSAPLGDVNGDKVPDVAISAYAFGNYYQGGVFIIHLTSSGSIKNAYVFTTDQASNAHSDNDRRYEYFGWDICALGDVNGDGYMDLAASSIYGKYYNQPNGFIMIIFLDKNGSPSSTKEIGGGSGFKNAYYPGGSMAALGDLDGNGAADFGMSTYSYVNDHCFYVVFLNKDGSIKSLGPDILVQNNPIAGTGVSIYQSGSTYYQCKYIGSYGDYDKDGLNDVIMSCMYMNAVINGATQNYAGGYIIVTMKKDGSAKDAFIYGYGFNDMEKFFDFKSSFYEGYYGQPSFGDLDNDGALDFISMTYPTNNYGLRLFRLSCPDGYGSKDSKCQKCSPGEETVDSLCTKCQVGYADEDSDPSTACTLCKEGVYTERGATNCTKCAAGTADTDKDATTPCVQCDQGQYAAEGSIVCVDCEKGTADKDKDPATPCDSCDVGEQSTVKATVCDKCAKGKADLDRDPSTDCQLCPTGTYTDVGQSTCPQCEAGKADTDGDPSTPCIACDPGFYSPAGSVSCKACAPGTADTDSNPATECETCPAGSYASTAETECAQCGIGTYDHDNNPTTPCIPCPTGKSSGVGATTCTECQAGTRYDSTTNRCIKCDPGTESGVGATKCDKCKVGYADLDSDASTPCEKCPDNKYAATEGQTSCTACDVGEDNEDGDQECDACSPGTYAAQNGDCPSGKPTCCLLCHINTIDDDQDSTTKCKPCPAGQKADEGQTQCTPCPAGTTRPSSEPTELCTTCPNGTYAAPGSSQNCTELLCKAGTYDDDLLSSTPCLDCPRGHFCPAGSAGADVKVWECPAGQTDDDLDASTPCVTCGPGTYVAAAQTGACPLHRCPAGTTDHDNDPATGCQPCPSGAYCPEGSAGATATLACAAGTYDSTGNATLPCVKCGAGTYAPAGSVSCPKCVAGFYDDDSDPATQCVACPSGTYTTEGATSCPSCPENSIDHDGSAATACQACPAGTYRAANVSANVPQCDPCPIGTYRATDALTAQCISCGAGYNCPEGSVSRKKCVAGTYSADGGVCLNCPSHTHAAEGAHECTPCAVNYFDDDGAAATPCRKCRGPTDIQGCIQVVGCNNTAGTDNVCIDCTSGLDLDKGSCVNFTIQDYMEVIELEVQHVNDRSPSQMRKALRETIAKHLQDNGFPMVAPDDVVIVSYSQTASGNVLNVVVSYVLDVDIDTYQRISDSGVLRDKGMALDASQGWTGTLVVYGQDQGTAASNAAGSSGLAGWAVFLIVLAVAVVVAAVAVVVVKRSSQSSSSYNVSSTTTKSDTMNNNPVFEEDAPEEDDEAGEF